MLSEKMVKQREEIVLTENIVLMILQYNIKKWNYG